MAALHLEVLPPPQRRLWAELGAIPRQFVLYGGTAIALRLGHRQSIDFDFFTSAHLDANLLYRQLPWLQDAETLRQSPDTLTVRANREGSVKLSFFATPNLRQLREPDAAPGAGVRLASLLDLAGTKASVVQQRAEAKDYLDIDALIHSGLSLLMVLAAARAIFGARFDPQSTLKALSYFGDGDLDTLEPAVRDNLRRAVREVDLESLPDLGMSSSGIGE
jgi:hypothetical protein